MDTADNRNEFSVEQLKGRPVIDRNGKNLGQVTDVSLNPRDWRVTGFIVDVDREIADRLHLDRPMMGNARLQVGAERVETFGDNLILNVGLAEIAGHIQGWDR